MKYTKTSLLLAVVGLLCWAAAAHASPLEPKFVAAEAKWLVHIDVDKAKTSPVVLTLIGECLARGKDVDKDTTSMGDEWGMNPAKDLHGITVFGTEHGPRHAIAILQATVDQEKCLKRLGEKVDYETTDYNGVKIYTWTKCFDDWARPRAMAFYKSDQVVFARNATLVRAGLDILEGKAANLGDKESPLTAKTPDGTFLFVRAMGLGEVKHRPILKTLDSFSYVVAEHNEQWCETATIVTDSEATAGLLKQAVEGWRALVSLYFHEQPDFVKLLDRTKLSVEGKTVHGTFEAPDQDVIAQMPTFCKIIRHWEWHHATYWEHHMRHHHWMHEKHEHEEDEH